MQKAMNMPSGSVFYVIQAPKEKQFSYRTFYRGPGTIELAACAIIPNQFGPACLGSRVPVKKKSQGLQKEYSKILLFAL